MGGTGMPWTDTIFLILTIIAANVFIVAGLWTFAEKLPRPLFTIFALSVVTTLPEVALVLVPNFRELTLAPLEFLTQAEEHQARGLVATTFPIGVLLGSTFANLFLAMGLAGVFLEPVIQGFARIRDLLFLLLALLIFVAPWFVPSFSPSSVGAALIGVGIVYLLFVALTEFRATPTEEDGESGSRVLSLRTGALGAVPWIVIGVVMLFIAVDRIYAKFFDVASMLFGLIGQTLADGEALNAGTLARQLTQPGAAVAASHAMLAVLGLLVVGFAVALPEVIATATAPRRKAGNVVIDNIAGASIFNLTVVLGGAIVIASNKYEDLLAASFATFRVEILILILGVLVLAVFFTNDNKLSRREGFVLLLIYLFFWIANLSPGVHNWLSKLIELG